MRVQFAAVFLIAAACLQAGGHAQEMGRVTYAVDVTGIGGLANFTSSDPTDFHYVRPDHDVFCLEFDLSESDLYAIDFMSKSIGTIDTATGEFNSIAPISGDYNPMYLAGGLSVDPMSGVFYLADYKHLYSIDVQTGVTTFVAEMVGNAPGGGSLGLVVDISFSPTGELFAFDVTTDSLYEIDKVSGAGTHVGTVPVDTDYAQGMDFDAATGVLYHAMYENEPFADGAFGYWDLTSGTFVELQSNSQFSNSIELEIAIRNGTVYAFNHSNANGNGFGKSMATFTATDPTDYTVFYGQARRPQNKGLCFNADGTRLFSLGTWNLGEIDLETNRYTYINRMNGDYNPADIAVQGFANDPTTDTFYMCSNHRLYTMDVSNASTELVAEVYDTLGNPLYSLEAMAFSSTGQLYAFEVDTNSLYAIDKSTGVATLVGTQAVTVGGFLHGLSFDALTGDLYHAINLGGLNGVYGKWDVGTGQFSVVADYSSIPDSDGGGLQFMFAIKPIQTLDVVSDSAVVNSGIPLAGSNDDTHQSDNVDWSLSRNPQQIQAVINVEFNATSHSQDPSAISVSLESSVFSRGPVTQVIEAYDFQLGQWETVDSRNAARFSDRVDTIELSGELSRFVGPDDRLVTRIRYLGTTGRAQFSANVDHLHWTISN